VAAAYLFLVRSWDHAVKTIIPCKVCGKDNVFDQPYRYHAGFSNLGFLYNESGDLTFVWASYDPLMRRLFPGKPPWALDSTEQQTFEGLLKPAPSGGHWKFTNPARCLHCAGPISPPMMQDIYYVLYPGSISADSQESGGLQAHTLERDLTRR
jgi:hypothetical protein